MRNEYHNLVRSNPELRHDPFVRQQLRREERRNEQDAMHPMNQCPAKSGYIFLLQNRVNLKSVGNINLHRKVYYDARRHGYAEDPSAESFAPLRTARLSNGQPANGWIYEEDANF